MVQHTRLINSRFSSNTYILSTDGEDSVWIVDPGDAQQILDWMTAHNKNSVAGILLTHSHFDHFYGANDILLRYPSCPIYIANEYGRDGLFDSRQNGSRYSELGSVTLSVDTDIVYYGEDFLLWNGEVMKVIPTPGHSDDSVCLLVGNMLFSGDTLIKDIRTVTKLKGGSVEKLEESMKVIESLKGKHLRVMPGHGDEFELDGYDLNKMNNNPLKNQRICQQ